jgi:hypothetical protein
LDKKRRQIHDFSPAYFHRLSDKRGRHNPSSHRQHENNLKPSLLDLQSRLLPQPSLNNLRQNLGL